MVSHKYAALACQSPDTNPRARDRAQSLLHTKGTPGTGGPEAGLDQDDACDVLAHLSAEESAGRLESESTGEWMYLFKPQVSGSVIYVKLILRKDCTVVSFHEDEDGDHEEATS